MAVLAGVFVWLVGEWTWRRRRGRTGGDLTWRPRHAGSGTAAASWTGSLSFFFRLTSGTCGYCVSVCVYGAWGQRELRCSMPCLPAWTWTSRRRVGYFSRARAKGEGLAPTRRTFFRGVTVLFPAPLPSPFNSITKYKQKH
jgi:hypothetical protein